MLAFVAGLAQLVVHPVLGRERGREGGKEKKIKILILLQAWRDLSSFRLRSLLSSLPPTVPAVPTAGPEK